MNQSPRQSRQCHMVLKLSLMVASHTFQTRHVTVKTIGNAYNKQPSSLKTMDLDSPDNLPLLNPRSAQSRLHVQLVDLIPACWAESCTSLADTKQVLIGAHHIVSIPKKCCDKCYNRHVTQRVKESILVAMNLRPSG
jgi:hypothetical protein